MRKIWNIYRKDLKSVFKARKLALLVAAIMLLPSIYAWVNIKAVWDPYSNTSMVPIAVATEDEGADINQKNINVGNETIKGLKENAKLGWVFVNYDEAERGVKYGDYYAYIYIPKDFSKKLTSIISGNPEKPEIEFAVNEKINAVAPKIATSGASSLIGQISKNFTEMLSNAIISGLNDAGVKLQQELPTIQAVENRVLELENNLPVIEELGRKSIELQAKLPQIKEKAQKIIELKDRIPDIEKAGNSILTIESKLPLVEEAGDKILELQDKVATMQNIEVIIDEIESNLSSVENNLSSTQDKINNVIDNPQITDDAHINLLSNEEQLAHFQKELTTIHNNIKASKASIKEKINGMISEINSAGSFVKNDLPTVEEKIHKAADFVRNDLSNLEEDITRASDLVQDKFPVFEEVVNKLADLAQNDLPEFEDKVRATADKIRKFQNNVNLNDIIDFLKLDPAKGSSFLSDPVLMNTKRIFPIPNYGSAMSALYTMLALWVGGTVLNSALPVDVKNAENIYKSYHIYFGRLLTFISVGIFQALIMTFGNLFLLHAYVVNKFWFVIFSVFISIVFVTITYTLRSVFGNIGNGISMILLVLQMSSSGATFPVNMTSKFFQTISPFMPFTHAVSILRETIGGMIVEIVIKNILILTIYIIFSICITLLLKRSLSKEISL